MIDRQSGLRISLPDWRPLSPPRDARERAATGVDLRRWTRAAPLLLLLVPIIFNAITLLPEFVLPLPSPNDDAFHFLFIQETLRALANGQNPFDFWSATLEMGFPQFLYYQQLPHLAVVALDLALLQRVNPLALFNLMRYVLLVGFPLTVYWSMRRMGFSSVAAAAGAAASPLFAGNFRYGFEYDSYVWRGFGMYAQLWAMHLSFIALACLYDTLDKGKGYGAAAVSAAALLLSEVIYGYMFAITAVLVLLAGLNRRNAGRRLLRLGIVGALALVLTAYFWLPFIRQTEYLNVSPYLQSWKYDSFGAQQILSSLVTGDLFDHGRLPVLTLLLGAGIVAAIVARSRLAAFALLLFAAWLLLYFGRPTWGPLESLLPFHQDLLLHRFIGSVDVGAVLLMGVGGDAIWRLSARLRWSWRAPALALVCLAMLLPALQERATFYGFNTRFMDRSQAALDADSDARSILETLQGLTPARTYAGLRADWGSRLTFGAGLYFTDLLTFNQLEAVSPPYQGYSLNSDEIWWFNDQDAADYDLFNAAYVVAPIGLVMPPFFRQLKTTARYTLFSVGTSGYAEFARSTLRQAEPSQKELLDANLQWLRGPGPAARQFIRYDFPGETLPAGPAPPGCADGGSINFQRELPGELDVLASCSTPATLVLKMTYHPNWRVWVDGKPDETFMVSPSYIGLVLPAGQHFVRAEYESEPIKTPLLILSGVTLLLLILMPWLRRMPMPTFAKQLWQSLEIEARLGRLDHAFAHEPSTERSRNGSRQRRTRRSRQR